MLFYNFRWVFSQREIENPYNYLVKRGFTHNLAHRIARNQINRISVENLERLCVILSCTPHDLLEWRPKKESETANHPLEPLRKESSPVNLAAYIKRLPLEQLAEVQKLIEGLKKDNKL